MNHGDTERTEMVDIYFGLRVLRVSVVNFFGNSDVVIPGIVSDAQLLSTTGDGVRCTFLRPGLGHDAIIVFRGMR